MTDLPNTLNKMNSTSPFVLGFLNTTLSCKVGRYGMIARYELSVQDGITEHQNVKFTRFFRGYKSLDDNEDYHTTLPTGETMSIEMIKIGQFNIPIGDQTIEQIFEGYRNCRVMKINARPAIYAAWVASSKSSINCMAFLYDPSLITYQQLVELLIV